MLKAPRAWNTWKAAQVHESFIGDRVVSTIDVRDDRHRSDHAPSNNAHL
jgi:hypothetical protein